MKNKQLLDSLVNQAVEHRKEHDCGGVPYEYGDVLVSIVSALEPKRVLEVGTGLGYTAACIAYGCETTHIDTIDQDESHLSIAQDNWEKLGVSNQITPLHGKAEAFLPTLTPGYDVIFFDGYAPQKKFLPEFERLLKPHGLLITANLFLQDVKGGMYLKNLQDETKWITGVFADTALSTKVT